jgi:hypothetical protein
VTKRQKTWDTFPHSDNSTPAIPKNRPSYVYEEDIEEVETALERVDTFIEEAHDAINKLFTKTQKRTQHMRGVRRKDAWQ